jgi:AcrR family transcriptional regulator
MTTALGHGAGRRRDLQKEQTRLDLALAAFDLARAHGLASVRVPDIADAAGVSTRTFNNYFPSKEAAIVWPTTLRTARLADTVTGRPADQPLAEVLADAVAGLYGDSETDGLPPGWTRDFRALAAAEPALHGEYLKSASAAETALADAIARRTGTEPGALQALVLAGVVVAAERAAVLYWHRQPTPPAPLSEVVRDAVTMAVTGTATRL